MTNAEDLLVAVSDDQPCGIDVSDDPRLQQIEMSLEAFSRNRALGVELKEESKPKWHDYVSTCEDLFREGKHLQVGVLLSLSWLSLEGLHGYLQGLRLIRGLILDYWDTFYPPVDEEDLRLMILENLVTPMGREGDYCEFMASLRRVPLSNSRLSVATLEEALGDAVPSDLELEDALDPSNVSGDVAIALQDSGPEFVDGLDRVAEEIQAIVGDLETSVRDRVGSNAPSWDPLKQNVAAIRMLLADYKTPEAAPEEIVIDADGGGGESAPQSQGFSGTINSKKDVCRALDEIIKFYERGESYDDAEKSPVPLMARGIRRTMDLGFREMVKIFNNETYDILDLIAGSNETEE